MPKILIVEDQVLTANHIKNILNDNNWHQIEIAYKINQAIELLETFVPDIVLLDINVEGKNSGIEWAKKYVKKAKIIFITGQTELETLQLALSTNPISYLTKPVKKIDLLAAITLIIVNFLSRILQVFYNHPYSKHDIFHHHYSFPLFYHILLE